MLKNTGLLRNRDTRGVYKFRYGHQIFYRLGRDIDNARGILAKELGAKRDDIVILEKGKQ